jgi:arylsulfatase
VTALRELWRSRLIQDLTDREEGFVADGNLVTGRPVSPILSYTRDRVARATGR